MNYYYYLEVLFVIESETKEAVNIFKLKQIIIKGIRDLFGEAGAGNEVDILKYEEKKGQLILRCFSNFYVKLRAALSFCCEYENLLFSFHVTKASPSLPSLLSNSDTYEF